MGWLRGQNTAAKITTTITAAIAYKKRLSPKKSIATSRIWHPYTIGMAEPLTNLDGWASSSSRSAVAVGCCTMSFVQGCAVLMFSPCAAGAPRPKLGKALPSFTPKLDLSGLKRSTRILR